MLAFQQTGRMDPGVVPAPLDRRNPPGAGVNTGERSLRWIGLWTERLCNRWLLKRAWPSIEWSQTVSCASPKASSRVRIVLELRHLEAWYPFFGAVLRWGAKGNWVIKRVARTRWGFRGHPFPQKLKPLAYGAEAMPDGTWKRKLEPPIPLR